MRRVWQHDRPWRCKIIEINPNHRHELVGRALVTRSTSLQLGEPHCRPCWLAQYRVLFLNYSACAKKHTFLCRVARARRAHGLYSIEVLRNQRVKITHPGVKCASLHYIMPEHCCAGEAWLGSDWQGQQNLRATSISIRTLVHAYFQADRLQKRCWHPGEPTESVFL